MGAPSLLPLPSQAYRSTYLSLSLATRRLRRPPRRWGCLSRRWPATSPPCARRLGHPNPTKRTRMHARRRPPPCVACCSLPRRRQGLRSSRWSPASRCRRARPRSLRCRRCCDSWQLGARWRTSCGATGCVHAARPTMRLGKRNRVTYASVEVAAAVGGGQTPTGIRSDVPCPSPSVSPATGVAAGAVSCTSPRQWWIWTARHVTGRSGGH